MRITFVPMLAQLTAIAFHIPLCIHFAIRENMGLRGLGLASSLTNLILFTSTFVYCLCISKINRALVRPNKDSFRGWHQYLAVCLPSTIIMCSEWWTVEILTLLAGLISVEAQAVQTIVASLLSILFEIPLGVQTVSCAMIGNCIGANNVPLAQRFFRLTAYANLTITVTLQTSLFFGKEAIAKFYSKDPTVQAQAVSVFKLLAFLFFFDSC